MRGMPAGAAALAAVLLFATTAYAQQRAPMFAAGRMDAVKRLTPEQRQERQFLREAAVHLRFENEASKLALAKSGDPRVREVAAALLNHCNATQPEVLHLLHMRGMAMPMLAPDELRVMKVLQKAAGTRFDRVYLDEVAVRANQVDAAQYERIATVTQDPLLRGWVERQLPAVRQHAQLASRARSGGGTNVMGSGPALLVAPPPRPMPKPPAPRV